MRRGAEGRWETGQVTTEMSTAAQITNVDHYVSNYLGYLP